jgi:(R,R)-butanediol dehydrogenase/meso-butanediol dehydrogenase/diacetyl reductase
METMLVGLIDGIRSVSLREVPVPRATPGTVVVDVAFCGVCGTDVHAFSSGAPYPAAVCGHEWCGTISDVGAEVKGLGTGDKVIVAVPPACGRCAPCLAGQTRYCHEVFMTQVGADALAPEHGGFASSIRVGPGRVMRALPGLSDRAAAQIEPATVTYHAVSRSGLALGDTVLVQGGGPIGLLTMQWALAAGAGRVVVSDPLSARREKALSLGAHEAVEPGDVGPTLRDRTSGLGPDVVFECVGRPETIQSAVDQVRRGGAVSIIGLADQQAPITPATWLIKEVTVTASLAYLHEEFEKVMSLAVDGRIELEALHDHTAPVTSLPEVLTALASGEATYTKVLIQPGAA